MAASEKENYTGRNISGRRAWAPGAQAAVLEHPKSDFAEGPQTVQIPIVKSCILASRRSKSKFFINFKMFKISSEN